MTDDKPLLNATITADPVDVVLPGWAHPTPAAPTINTTPTTFTDRRRKYATPAEALAAQRASQRAYAQRNREKRAEYRAENAEWCRIYDARYRETHRDERAQAAKERRRINAAKVKAFDAIMAVIAELKAT